MKNQDSESGAGKDFVPLKRSRSEGSILDSSDIAANKSMGGSEGNISQCSVQSNKTRKSAELIIEDTGKNNKYFWSKVWIKKYETHSETGH